MMKKIVSWMLMIFCFCYAAAQEDKAVLLVRANSEMQLNPQKSEEIAQYIHQNFSDKTSSIQADALLSTSYFLQNKISESVQIIAKSKEISPENIYSYTGILLALGLNPESFFTEQNNVVFTEISTLEKAFEKREFSVAEKSLNQLISETNFKNKNQLKEVWLKITDQISGSENRFSEKYLLQIFDLYPDDLQFKIRRIQYLISKKRIPEAGLIFEELPEKEIEKSSNIVLKKDFYNTKIQFFVDSENAAEYIADKTHTENLEKQITNEEMKARSVWFSLMEKRNQKLTQETIRKGKTWIAATVVFFGVLIILAFLRFNQQEKSQKQLELFQEKIKALSEKKIQPNIIPEKTENLLLGKLDKFEQSTDYLNPEISLQNLAKKLDTNTKYLSETINTHKEKNFNSYINELRIDYILLKLQEEPIYRNYKIKYLAEETGFSSHSLFASVFKSITGMPPMTYIKFLNENKS